MTLALVKVAPSLQGEADRYEQALENKPLSSHTKRAYRARVRAFLEYRASRQGEPFNTTVHHYKHHLLEQGGKPSTINGALAAIDDYLQTIGEPRHGIKKHEITLGQPKALGQQEVRQLQGVLINESPRNAAIILLMLEAGLRISEVVALRRGDVPMSARTGDVIVRCGKGGKHRKVKMSSKLREAITAYTQTLDHTDAQEAPLFPGKDGQCHLGTNAVDHLVRRLGKEAHLSGLSAHRLRHTCLTNLVRSGADLMIVKTAAGHAKLETTARYTQPGDADMEAAMERGSRHCG